MRTVYVDYTPILPFLDTGFSKYITWIMADYAELPEAFQVIQYKETHVDIYVIYKCQDKTTKKIISVNNMDVHMSDEGKLFGFSLEMIDFQYHLMNLISWIRDNVDNNNSQSIKLNYKIIANLMQHYCNDLFVPAQ